MDRSIEETCLLEVREQRQMLVLEKDLSGLLKSKKENYGKSSLKRI